MPASKPKSTVCSAAFESVWDHHFEPLIYVWYWCLWEYWVLVQRSKILTISTITKSSYNFNYWHLHSSCSTCSYALEHAHPSTSPPSVRHHFSRCEMFPWRSWGEMLAFKDIPRWRRRAKQRINHWCFRYHSSKYMTIPTTHQWVNVRRFLLRNDLGNLAVKIWYCWLRRWHWLYHSQALKEHGAYLSGAYYW